MGSESLRWSCFIAASGRSIPGSQWESLRPVTWQFRREWGGGERPAPAHTRQVPVSTRASPWRIGHIAQRSLLRCCRTDTPHTHTPAHTARHQEAAARRQHPQHQAGPVRHSLPLGRPTEAGALLMPSTPHFPEEFSIRDNDSLKYICIISKWYCIG